MTTTGVGMSQRHHPRTKHSSSYQSDRRALQRGSMAVGLVSGWADPAELPSRLRTISTRIKPDIEAGRIFIKWGFVGIRRYDREDTLFRWPALTKKHFKLAHCEVKPPRDAVDASESRGCLEATCFQPWVPGSPLLSAPPTHLSASSILRQIGSSLRKFRVEEPRPTKTNKETLGN